MDSSALFKFAYCPDYEGQLRKLAELAMKEEWDFRTSHSRRPFPILHNYIQHTFTRLREEEVAGKPNKISYSNDARYACFNTGLYTENYELIYGLFEPNRNEGRQPWCLKGFYKESDHALHYFSPLPLRAEYFTDISDLIYDYRLEIRINIDHILDNQNNLDRLPVHMRDRQKALPIMHGALQIAKRRVAANYKLAVPQYYNGKIQLLIPLCFEDNSKADVALPIYRENNFYMGRTLLTLEMAYNNARLIARPDSEWLRP